MGLFGFGNKKATGKANEQKSVTIAGGEHSVKILGTGCAKCSDLFDNAIKACSQDNYSCTITKEEDVAAIVSYGIMTTPALVIDEKLLSQGVVLSPKEVSELLKTI